MKFNHQVLICIAAFVLFSFQAQAEEGNLRTVQKILASSKEWTLYSLEPHPPGDTREERIANGMVDLILGPPKFHTWKILGQTKVVDAKTRKALLKTLKKGIREEQKKKSKQRKMGLLVSGGCFQPRHGIRATHDGKTVDFVICFECESIEVILMEKTFYVGVSATPQPVFDRVLKDANVPLNAVPKIKK